MATVLLVHGAFAESASWNGVVERLTSAGHDVAAVANPLRSLAGDAAYVRDVITSIGGPVVLVGHSYGGMVITEAAAGNDAVTALVYVCAFTADTGESAFDLSTKFPGSTPATRSPPTRSRPAAPSSPSAKTPSTTSSPPTCQPSGPR